MSSDDTSENTVTEAVASPTQADRLLAAEPITIDWDGKLRTHFVEEIASTAPASPAACLAPCFEEYQTRIEISSTAQAHSLLTMLDELVGATPPRWLTANQRRTINRIRGTLRNELNERDIEYEAPTNERDH